MTAIALPRRASSAASGRALGLVLKRPEALLVLIVLLVAAIAHAVNMFDFPYYENDEGSYMSQAWSVVTRGSLAPYTYWYDHVPAGWLLLAAWSALTGGFYTFGVSIESGRVLMLVLQVFSTLFVYLIARRITGRAVFGMLAALIFALSAYGIYYHRRVLLDNIATFWLLLGIVLLLARPLALSRAWLAALVLGISVLSKEPIAFAVPPFLALVFVLTDKPRRWVATFGAIVIAGSVISLYVLMAILKGELFPSGTLLGGDTEHVSLLQTLSQQAGKDADRGIWEAGSNFWTMVTSWAIEEPLLVIGGSLAAVVSVLFIRRRPPLAMLGLATLGLWFFLARGGVVAPFYLLPLLPLLAICIAGVAAEIAGWLAARRFGAVTSALLISAIASVAATATVAGFGATFHGDHTELWTSRQASAQREALVWVTQTLPASSSIAVDPALWMDLQQRKDGGRPYELAHWFWKVDLDPEIREGVFEGDWRNLDYIISSPQMEFDSVQSGLDMTASVLAHSTPIAQFESGGWPLTVRRTDRQRTIEAPLHTTLVRMWSEYKAGFLSDGRIVDPQSGGDTTSEGQSYGLLAAVYMDDRPAFDRLWAWTQANLQVRSDALLSWRWGLRPDGSTGVLDVHAATDADQDVALALLLASRHWDEPAYAQEALAMIGDIWELETVRVGRHRYLLAGDWAGEERVVNPSYLAPYAYRVFAEVDAEHDWSALVDSSYRVLEAVSRSPELGGPAGAVPDWVSIDQRGNVAPGPDSMPRSSTFSYDASRVPWRLAVDWGWYREPRAWAALEAISLPREAYARDGRISAAYDLDGASAADHESISMYAGVLPTFLVSGEPELAQRLFAEKVLAPTVGTTLSDPANYYDRSWAWLGTALLDGAFANLWAGEQTLDWKAPASLR